MPGKKGSYSKIIIYDERRRYYYLWPQKNKPFLDDEIRDMGVGLLDQVRRAVQNTYGDVATPYSEYAGAVSTVDSFRVRQSALTTDRNFKVMGGVSLDHPAVLYAKGFYVFLAGDLEYKQQMYSSDTVDIQSESNKYLTLTPIPALTTPSVDRIDIVYVHLHFEETSSATGTDTEVYRDTGLKNPIVGTDTANRLRAVIDIKVRENWTEVVNKNIFSHNEFLGGVSGDSSDPTDLDYKIPIAAIYRPAFQNTILDSQIVDLLSLYNKRVMTLEEVTYRTRHGGYTETGMYELGLTGFQPQYPGAKVDERAFATGLNQGLGSEAFNSNSVTPRILDNDGKFFMGSLMVGHDTGLVSYETGSEGLSPGEVIVKDLSARSIYVGYGETGITGMREYSNSMDVVVRGDTGHGGVVVKNIDGVTGSKTMYVGALHGGSIENFFVVDYRGRIGLNTFTPGWVKPDGEWNTDRYNDGLGGITGINVIEEINGSLQVDDHLLINKDAYVKRDLFGRTWKIPEVLSKATPALFGFTGIPSGGFTGIADSVAAVVFKRAIAVMGETGITGYGYTGMGAAGQYECYDSDGRRMFTIGDLGEDFDRIIKTLYGSDARRIYISKQSFMDLPSGYGAVAAGDTVSYDFVLSGGSHITGVKVLTVGGMAGVEEIRDHILNNGEFSHGYSRSYSYTFYNIDPPGGTETRTGVAYGVQIIEDLFGYSTHLVDSDGNISHGRLILKNMPEDPVHVEWLGFPDPSKPEQYLLNGTLTVNRISMPAVSVSFTEGAFYGEVEFGGALSGAKFAKLDLGEAADAWLINGDVFFNGNGIGNRVVFSPNALFRNDVFVYGTLFSDSQYFNFANIQNLQVRCNAYISNKVAIDHGLAVGDNALVDFDNMVVAYPDLLSYVKGKSMAQSLVLRDESANPAVFGSVFFSPKAGTGSGKVYAYVGGAIDATSVPFGLHLIDDRPGVPEASKFSELVIDAGDGRGNSRNVLLNIKGDLKTGNYFSANYLGVGSGVVLDTHYRLQVNGQSQINGTLWVQNLRFIGSEAPEGSTDIIEPGNVEVRGRVGGTDIYGGYIEQSSTNILREKKFTSTKSIVLFNEGQLGATNSYTDSQDYYSNFILSNYNDPTPTPIKVRWAMDNVTYTESEIDTIISGSTDPNTVIVDNITVPKYKKYRCERVVVATLGTITMTWDGYVPSISSSSIIKSYKFSSPYFRGRNGQQDIDWYPESSRAGEENFVIRVMGDLIDQNAANPSIFKVDTCLGLYIPKSSWWQCSNGPDLAHGYYSQALFYPFENIMYSFNSIDIYRQTYIYTPSPDQDPYWKLALYPKLREQVRSDHGANYVREYTGYWDLDVVILPATYDPSVLGKIANLNGKLFISYSQS